jgi:hypothetical protein
MPEVTVHNLPIDVAWWPDEDRLGEHLRGVVVSALARGGAPTAFVVARRSTLHLIPAQPLVDQKQDLSIFLAGLARWNDEAGPPEAVGVLGRVQVRRGDAPWMPLALVFLEWPDGRWWEWRAPLDAAGVMRPDAQVRGRAVDGLPRPSGLGGWWRLSRLREPDLGLRKVEDRGPKPGLVVH